MAAKTPHSNIQFEGRCLRRQGTFQQHNASAEGLAYIYPSPVS